MEASTGQGSNMIHTEWRLSPPAFSEIEAAAERIAPACIVTPLLEAPALNARIGGRLLIKAEGLQRTGSFKLRGAYNRLAQLSDDERQRGVIAYSSGNHGQAVAAAARLLGTTAVVVMPADAPAAKIRKSHGAEVVFYDRYRDDREAITLGLAHARGLVLVPPYEDRRIIAGAGTLAREVFHQSAAMGAQLDAFLVGCSGGGLTAGCALALEALSPATAVYAVEPAAFDDLARSLVAGERLANDVSAHSLCDSLMAATTGALTFSIHRRLLAGALSVSDEEVVAAMAVAFDELGLVVEPGGAVALAAVLSGRLDARGKTVAVALTGRNVDRALAAKLLGEAG
jgi:threonine dehydratase